MSETETKKPTKSLKIIIFIWFLVMFLGLMFYTTQRLVDFDPNAELLDQSLDNQYYMDLKAELSEQYESVAGKAFHFSKNGCFCNLVAQQHISQVGEMISAEQFSNVNVSLSEHSEFERFLPSTPAIALYNSDGALMYIGPYSTGYLCVAGNGLVEEIIPRMGQSVDNPIVMTLARGCYCNN